MLETTLYSTGHSKLVMNEFLDRLRQHGISILIDIRSHPYSSRFPHFSTDALRASCLQAGIEYHWAGRHLRTIGGAG